MCKVGIFGTLNKSIPCFLVDKEQKSLIAVFVVGLRKMNYFIFCPRIISTNGVVDLPTIHVGCLAKLFFRWLCLRCGKGLKRDFDVSIIHDVINVSQNALKCTL